MPRIILVGDDREDDPEIAFATIVDALDHPNLSIADHAWVVDKLARELIEGRRPEARPDDGSRPASVTGRSV